VRDRRRVAARDQIGMMPADQILPRHPHQLGTGFSRYAEHIVHRDLAQPA
jgi:hypothetical protein